MGTRSFSLVPVMPRGRSASLTLQANKYARCRVRKGYFAPRWSPNGRYVLAEKADFSTLLLFDFQTQKWTEFAKGGLSWPNWSKDGQYVYVTGGPERAPCIGYESVTAKWNR